MRTKVVMLSVMVAGVAVHAANGADVPPLVQAIRSGDRQAARTLLQKGANVNEPQADGATALHWASHRDDLEAAEFLLRAGAKPNATNDLGVTPLCLASENGSPAMIERLLKGGADVNTACLPNKVTPLMIAARSGNLRAVKALLGSGANPDAKETARDQTALMWAAAEQHADVIQALVEVRADVGARSRTTDVLVSLGRSEDKTAPLRQQLETVTEGGYTPLLFAARSGDVESAIVLIRAGANPNDQAPSGASALVIAAHSGHSELAQALLERGADPNAAGAGYAPLHAAVLRGDEPLVKALVASGADVNARLEKGTIAKRFHKEWAFNQAWIGATPAFLAAKFADTSILRLLIDAGADPRFVMKDGTTMLMAAAGMGTPGIGLDNTGTDRQGRSMDPAEIEVALALNEDTRSVMPSGIGTVHYLLSIGADVNARSGAGDTALHAAAQHGFESVIEALVKRGAQLDIKSKTGLTPLGVAVEEKRTQTADLLRKLGGE